MYQKYLFLPNFENVAIMQEKWLHLVDTSGSNENEIEDGKQTELQIKGAVSHLPKCETTEQRCKYVENNLIPYIILKAVSASHVFNFDVQSQLYAYR